MGDLKIRVRRGDDEFDGQGEVKEVSRHLGAWMDRVFGVSTSHTPKEARTGAKSEKSTNPPQQADHVFRADQTRGLVIIKGRVDGESKYADALILTLFGHKTLLGQEEVLVTKLGSSLEASALAPKRVANVAEPLRVEQLVTKTGNRSGSKYSLTVAGERRAQELMSAMLKKMGV